MLEKIFNLFSINGQSVTRKKVDFYKPISIILNPKAVEKSGLNLSDMLAKLFCIC